MARAAPRRDCGREGALSCCVDAALLLLGAEKAESVAGRKEVVQDRRDRVGFVWGSAARWVLLLWGRGVCVGAAPSPRWGPPGHPWLHGAAKPCCPAPARQKCSNPIFYLTNVLVCWNSGSNLPSALSAGLCLVGKERGGQGDCPPHVTAARCAGWCPAVCRLRRDAAEGAEQMAGR